MKKMKLKLNKNNKTKKTELKSKAPVKESVNTIQQLIFEDVKNINKFNIIIEEFILSLQNSDEKNLNQLFNILLEIFDYFLVKNKEKISNDLKLFLDEKLNTLVNVISEVLSPDEDMEENVMKTIFKNTLKLAKYINEEKVLFIFETITNFFILNEDVVETNYITLITNSLVGNREKKHLKILIETLHQKLTQLTNLNDYTLYNIYNFFISLPNNIASDLKYTYQNILVTLINNSSLPKEILKNILINLNKTIFDNLENPLIFSDYLINIYERSSNQEFDIKVLSLSGLFVLITKYKLDYNNYYNILYKTIGMKYFDSNGIKTVFDSSYRNRLFKILELSLKSTTVPIIVILSFIKKLARVCLSTSSNNIAIILGIIQNIMKMHPRAVILLKRIKKAASNSQQNEKVLSDSKFNWGNFVLPEDTGDKDELPSLRNDIAIPEHDEDFSLYSKFEQFDDEELDTYKTNAQMSCLWELYTLKNHFSFKIRNIVNKFESNFLKSKEFDLNSISNLKEEDLMYEINEGAHFYLTNSTSEEDVTIFNNKINILF